MKNIIIAAIAVALFFIAAAMWFGPGRYQLVGSGGEFMRLDTVTGNTRELFTAKDLYKR
jgi:hypothetical protein